MANDLSFAIKGVKEFRQSTREIESIVDKATLATLRRIQNKIKLEVRRNLRGAPRWTERAGKAHGDTFQVEGTTGQHHFPRSGGPGRMTGDLYRGVGAVRRPIKVDSGTWIGGVGVGKNINHFKKGTLEKKFPYFRPAVLKVQPEIRALYEKAWDKSIHKQGGIL